MQLLYGGLPNFYMINKFNNNKIIKYSIPNSNYLLILLSLVTVIDLWIRKATKKKKNNNNLSRLKNKENNINKIKSCLNWNIKSKN